MHLKKEREKEKGGKKEAEKMTRKQEASFLFLLSWLYRLIVNRPGCMALRSYHGSKHGEGMTDVVSVLCLFES